MFKSKSGKIFANPAIGRQHDKDEAAGKGAPARKSEAQDSGGGDHADKVDIHHPDGADNPSPGKFHTVTHRNGDEEHADHDSMDDAVAHAHSNMDSQSDGGDGSDMAGQGDDDDAEGETCPDCGTEMVDGKCPNCGYSDQGSDEGSDEDTQGY